MDFEDFRELIGDEGINKLESVVVANVGDVDGLCDAFRGCHAIFHTSSFVDPHGISGYSVSFTLQTNVSIFLFINHRHLQQFTLKWV